MSKQPNVLFLLPDQHRGDWLGTNPELPLETPNIKRLMRMGTTFHRAYCPSPLCAPCRASLASGRDYDNCGVPGNEYNYPLDVPTYYQALRDAGYRVAGVGKFDLHKDVSDWSNMDWYLDGSRLLKEWGFTEGVDNEGKLDGVNVFKRNGGPRGPYLNFLEQRGLAQAYVEEHMNVKPQYNGAYVSSLPDDAYCDNWLSENGLYFLENFPSDRPWHLVVNFTGPHDPMDVTQSMHDAWKDTPLPMPHANEQEHLAEEEHQRNRQHYAAMIENIDRQAGRFIDKVEERGELENTIIVYASDHGEMLGDHGYWGKNVYLEPSVRVPLIVAGPGFQEGVQSDALVAIHDLAPTFIDAAGAERMPNMDAQSFLPVLRGERKEHRPVVLTGLQNWRAVIDQRFKLIEGAAEYLILHDLVEDPWEDVNVADQYPDKVEELRRWLPAEKVVE